MNEADPEVNGSTSEAAQTAPESDEVLDFGPCRIRFDHRVLEPRPWTLAQSRWAAELADELQPGAILELCSGAGQIGLVAAVLTGRSLIQVDLDPVACSFAVGNAAAAGLANRVQVRCAPLDVGVGEAERFPLIVADPPYLRTDGIDRFPNDPRLAVDGGSDGLALARTCLKTIDQALDSGGVAILQLAGLKQFKSLEEGIPADLVLESVRELDDERALGLFRRRS